mgnify:CR=1 FL=1
MKILHYCWFGSTPPPDLLARLARWQTLHPSWKIREWNNSNIDLSGCPYAEGCFQRRDWAYLSDYVRLQVLSREGGAYLDTDVELLKPLDVFADDLFHIGYMHNCALGTAVMISPSRHPLLARLIDQYRRLPADRGINNNAILTEFFLKHVEGFRLTGKSWSTPTLCLHPKTWFEQPTSSNRGGYAVHLFNRSWDVFQRAQAQAPLNWRLFVLKRCLRTLWEEVCCFYFPFYLRDRFHMPVLPLPALHG